MEEEAWTGVAKKNRIRELRYEFLLGKESSLYSRTLFPPKVEEEKEAIYYNTLGVRFHRSFDPYT